MKDIPAIVWGIIIGFVIAAVQAARRSTRPSDFLPAFLTIVGVSGLRRRSPILYWCGVLILAFILLAVLAALFRGVLGK